MQTRSGILVLTKTERKALELLRDHAEKDMSYGWGGSYGGHDEDNKKEEREYEQKLKQGRLGLAVINWVLKITE